MSINFERQQRKFLPYPLLFLAAEAAVGAKNDGVLLTQPPDAVVVDVVLGEEAPAAAVEEVEPDGVDFVEDIEATERKESEVLLRSLNNPVEVLPRPLPPPPPPAEGMSTLLPPDMRALLEAAADMREEESMPL